MDKKINPNELNRLFPYWEADSFEEAVDKIEDWLDYALKRKYGKEKAEELKSETIHLINSGQLTEQRLKLYDYAVEENPKDIRYLCPYYLAGYFVGKARAVEYYAKGNTIQAFATLGSMYFFTGMLTENIECSTINSPNYIGDPVRQKAVSMGGAAKHQGNLAVKKRLAELIKEKYERSGWKTNKEAATEIEPILLAEYFIKEKSNQRYEKSKPEFKINLNSGSLHERILIWMRDIPEIKVMIDSFEKN